jgi:hypothetical protein
MIMINNNNNNSGGDYADIVKLSWQLRQAVPSKQSFW